MPVEHDERLRVGHGERSEKDRIHEAIDGGVRSDAKCKGERGEAGEDPVLLHASEGVAEVLEELLPEIPGPHGSALLL